MNPSLAGEHLSLHAALVDNSILPLRSRINYGATSAIEDAIHFAEGLANCAGCEYSQLASHQQYMASTWARTRQNRRLAVLVMALATLAVLVLQVLGADFVRWKGVGMGGA